MSDRIRVTTETLNEELIDVEPAAWFIGAAPFERTGGPGHQRNGAQP